MKTVSVKIPSSPGSGGCIHIAFVDTQSIFISVFNLFYI